VKRRSLFSLLCLAILVFGAAFFVASAQADTAEGTPVATPEVTNSENEALAQELQDITEKYFEAVETYRDLEKKYTISREQYYQLNTLAAQDDVIMRGQDVLRARAVALRLYYEYLTIIVKRTRGIELTDKNDILTRLDDGIRQLQAYEEGIRELDTREKIDQHFKVFNTQKNAFQHAAYTALTAVKMGEIQTAIDSSSVLVTDLKGTVNTTDISAADRAVKQRGLEEVDRLLQRSKNNLLTQHTQFLRYTVSGNYNEPTYRQFQSDIEFSYTQLRQAYNFLREVAAGL
jgi:hypothetical protein